MMLTLSKKISHDFFLAQDFPQGALSLKVDNSCILNEKKLQKNFVKK
jgi:hypothetical protein